MEEPHFKCEESKVKRLWKALRWICERTDMVFCYADAHHPFLFFMVETTGGEGGFLCISFPQTDMQRRKYDSATA